MTTVRRTIFQTSAKMIIKPAKVEEYVPKYTETTDNSSRNSDDFENFLDTSFENFSHKSEYKLSNQSDDDTKSETSESS